MLGACLLHAEEADGDLLPRSCRHGSRLGGGHVIGEGDVIVAGFSRVLSAQCPLTFDKGVVKGKVHMCSQCDLPCHWAGARACGTPLLFLRASGGTHSSSCHNLAINPFANRQPVVGEVSPCCSLVLLSVYLVLWCCATLHHLFWYCSFCLFLRLQHCDVTWRARQGM
jgi:hypothetical protein